MRKSWARTRADFEWRRSERLAVLMGASAMGAVSGVFATLAIGRAELSVLVLTAAPLLTLSLYLTGRTLTEAFSNGAHGCAAASILHVAALLAWPLTCLLSPLSPVLFWLAPFVAVSALVLFASCWTFAPRAIYRMTGQALLVAALTAHQGVFVVMSA